MKKIPFAAESPDLSHKVFIAKYMADIPATALDITVRYRNRTMPHQRTGTPIVHETHPEMAGTRSFPYGTNSGFVQLEHRLHRIPDLQPCLLSIIPVIVSINNPQGRHHIRYRLEVNPGEMPDASFVRLHAEPVELVGIKVIESEYSHQSPVALCQVPVCTEFPQQPLATFGIPFCILETAGKGVSCAYTQLLPGWCR